jgi:FtsH-binding integral membrane protein
MTPTMTIASLLFNRTVTIFTHPYWGSGPFLAKLAVAAATFLWALAVMIEGNPLDPLEFPLYITMTNFMPAKYWAWGAFGMGVGSLIQLMLKRPPVSFGAIAYFGMMMFWAYIAVSIWTIFPYRPAHVAAVSVIGALSVYAFMATPRRRRPVNDATLG